ncbi:MAG: DUF2892 domain-containing protein [Chloroflexi bacterium]|jgi:uncharacterized membrane protein|nr:DUF2892 domain-containing protein [Chloroflexota bacterium]
MNERRETGQQTNIGPVERALSLFGGALLMGFGLRSTRRINLPSLIASGLLLYRGFTGHSFLNSLLGRRPGFMRMGRRPTGRRIGLELEEEIVVRRPVEEVYAFWRNLENLPRVMRHLESVTSLGNGRHHWVATLPGRTPITLEWDTAILNERPNELITWRSFTGSEVDQTGSIHFRQLPENQGTEVRLVLEYVPMEGLTAGVSENLFGEAMRKEIRDDMERIKRAFERGEPLFAERRPAIQRPTTRMMTPSQAEGDRQTIDEDLCEKGLSPEDVCYDVAAKAQGETERPSVDLPSQAEGDRQTVEEDLRRRGFVRVRR